MDKEELFNSVMQKVCKAEFSAFEDVPKHNFSHGFDRKIKRLEREEPAKKSVPFRRRRTFILIAVIAAVIAVCGFATLRILFVADDTDEYWMTLTSMARNAPETIEHYYLPELPEGFYPDDSSQNFCNEQSYTAAFTDGFYHLYFSQHTASIFRIGFNKEAVTVVNNISDGTIDVYNENIGLVSRIWTDGEYIYEVGGCLDYYEMKEFKKLHEVYPEYYTGY